MLISIYYLFQLYQNKVSFSKLKELTLTTMEKYIMKRNYGMCYKHSSFLSKTFAADTHGASSSCPRYRTKLPNWYFRLQQLLVSPRNDSPSEENCSMTAAKKNTIWILSGHFKSEGYGTLVVQNSF